MVSQTPVDSRPVLIVDDEPNIVRALSYLLEREGFPVVSASTGEEGVTLARALHPRLVLLDVMLPGISGYDVCRAIRANPEEPRPHVIFLSARVQAADEVAGLAAGADEYLTKPFSPNCVAARVRALWPQLGGADRPARRQASSEFSP